MDIKEQDIIFAVMSINEELFEKTGGNEWFTVEFRTVGNACSVELTGIQIWCSEDDTRIYYDGTDTYEAIEVCLRRKVNEFLAMCAFRLNDASELQEGGVVKKPTLVTQFERWLHDGGVREGEIPTRVQQGIAQQLLSLPRMGGKSWLIDRLYEFEHRDL